MTVWEKKLQPVSGQIPAKPIRYIRSGKVRIIVEDESTIELRAEDNRVILICFPQSADSIVQFVNLPVHINDKCIIFCMSDNEKTQNTYSIKKNREEKTITLTKLQNEDCISVTNLKKQYVKDSAYTLDGISFNVKYGTVFGFLGPNGAGKTTTLKILTTLLSPSSGAVYIFGKDLSKNQLEIKRKIGVVSQNPSFEANLTVERALDLYGMLWGLHDRKLRKEKVNKILETFDLESIRNAKNEELSIGQRRRVQVAREFMHDMDLLFLDEPTVGLDPSARRQLLDYIKAHVRSGLTVFFTTHIMEEAEYLCDEIAIIDKGKIIAFDTPTGLIQKCGGGSKTIEIIFKDILNQSFVDLLKSTISKNKSDNNSVISDGKRTVTIRVTNTEQVISEILQHVSKYGLQIENITINPPSLEEVFLSIVESHDSTSEVRK